MTRVGEDAADWERIKELVADVLEADGEVRERRLAELHTEGEAIASRVRRLVRAADADEARVLDKDAGSIALSGDDIDWTGEKIGSYRVVRFLARGGMGEVYEAVQDGTDRRVALKLLARHTRRDRSRFLREGRLLGQLSHPAIAQVIDADVYRVGEGVHLPYLALEFVDGLALTHYAEREALGRSARLRLFVELCRGVEHAHRKGIVHRDLKPDNVLVARGDDAVGHPKILDFGIAALMDTGDTGDTGDTARGGEDTRLTREGDLVGTLAYMAPEQARGEAVDARTDVYALGAMLYELLVGRPPLEFAGRSLSDSLRLLEKSATPRASLHDRSLRGDLDTIVATAMSREASRRYASAAELADDIERHLAQRPIAARPASRLYRTLKFTQRNRFLVASVTAAFVLLTLGIVGTSLGFLRARAEAAHVREVNRFLASILASPSPFRMGREVTLRAVLDEHAEEIDRRFGDRPLTAAELHASIGQGYFQSGELARGHAHLVRAAALRRQQLGASAHETLETERLANHMLLALDPGRPGNVESSRDLAARAGRALGAESLVTLEADADVASALAQAEELDEAIELYRATLERAERVAESDDVRDTLANGLAVALSDAGRYEEAGLAYERRAALLAAAYEPEHPERLLNAVNLAINLGDRGDAEGSLRRLEDLEEPMRRVLGPTHPDYLSLAIARASTLSTLDRDAEASAEFERLLPILEETLGPRHEDTLLALSDLAVCYLYQERVDEAETTLRSLIERALPLGEVGEDFLLRARSTLVGVLSSQLRLEESLELSRQVTEGTAAILGEEHPRTLISRNNVARLLHRLDRPEEAVAIYAEVTATWRRTLPEEKSTLRTLLWNFGRAQVAAGAWADAERTLLEVQRNEAGTLSPSPEEVADELAGLRALRVRASDE